MDQEVLEMPLDQEDWIKKTRKGDGVKAAVVKKGGKGSGNFGHAGRPGKVGGSARQSYEFAFENSPWADAPYSRFNKKDILKGWFYDKGFDLTTVYKLQDVTPRDKKFGVRHDRRHVLILLERHSGDHAFQKFVDSGFTAEDFDRLDSDPMFKDVPSSHIYYGDDIYDYVKGIADKYGVSMTDATHLLGSIDGKFFNISQADIEKYLHAGFLDMRAATEFVRADFPVETVADAIAAGVDPFDAEAVMAYSPGQSFPVRKDTIPDFMYSGMPPMDEVSGESTYDIKDYMDATVEEVASTYNGPNWDVPDILNPEIRGLIKQRIAKNISRQTGGSVSEKEASNVVAVWADTSNKSGEAQIVQETVANMFNAKFGTELSTWQKSIASDYDKKNAGMIFKDTDIEQTLAAMYSNTQRLLREQGHEEIILYRGFSAPSAWADSIDEAVESPDNALSSWTVDKQTALHFARGRTDYGIGGNNVGVVVAMDVPAERILSTALTGFGSLPEYEVTLIGSDDDSARVIDVYERENHGTK